MRTTDRVPKRTYLIDNAHTHEGASTDSVHETSDVNPKPQDKSDDDNSGTDKAQQNQRPQTEPSV